MAGKGTLTQPRRQGLPQACRVGQDAGEAGRGPGQRHGPRQMAGADRQQQALSGQIEAGQILQLIEQDQPGPRPLGDRRAPEAKQGLAAAGADRRQIGTDASGEGVAGIDHPTERGKGSIKQFGFDRPRAGQRSQATLQPGVGGIGPQGVLAHQRDLHTPSGGQQPADDQRPFSGAAQQPDRWPPSWCCSGVRRVRSGVQGLGPCIRMGPTVVEGVVNHCLLEVVVLEAPQVRYTQDNQTPVAEMAVELDGLRPDDPPGQLKVVGWGNLAQDLQNRVQVGQRLMIEGRLRMSTVSRADGTKEKRAEFTLARLHPLTAQASAPAPSVAPSMAAAMAQGGTAQATGSQAAGAPVRTIPRPTTSAPRPVTPAARPAAAEPPPPTWNTSPLVPDLADDDDEIPF